VTASSGDANVGCPAAGVDAGFAVGAAEGFAFCARTGAASRLATISGKRTPMPHTVRRR